MFKTELNSSPTKTLARGPIAALFSLGLGVALTCSSLAVQAAGHPVTVSERVELGVPPARAWAAINDFMGWPAWHPAFAGTRLLKGDGHGKGTVRLLKAKDGAQFTEELVAYDAAAYSYQYRILESPAPVTGYLSKLEVKPTKTGSVVVWSSSFEVKQGTSDEDAKKLISGVYRAGLDNLASAMEQ